MNKGGNGLRVMYNGTVRNLSFADQCHAATLAGCSAITIAPSQYLDYVANGLPTREILAIAAEHGVEISHLDPFARWTPKWVPDNHEGNYPLAAIAFDIDDFLRMCSALRCRSFTALGTHPAGALSLTELIDHFGALCTRAASEGLRVDLEFIPFSGLTTLDQCWSVVDGAAAPNSGIMFDTWHFRRSSSTEALLEQIPGPMITGVQLSDAIVPAPQDVAMIADCMMGRLAPGEGDLRVQDIVKILRGTGGLNNVGPEIFSSRFDSLSAAEIGAECARTMATVLA